MTKRDWWLIEFGVISAFVFQFLDVWVTLHRVFIRGTHTEMNPAISVDNFLVLSIIKIASPLILYVGFTILELADPLDRREKGMRSAVLILVALYFVKSLVPVLINIGVIPYHESIGLILDPIFFSRR